MADLLSGRRRIVVKIGSSLLVDPTSGLKSDWLASLAQDLAALAQDGAQILLVSSGAIALGRTVLKLPRRSLKLDEAQAAAAVGQIALARAWSEALGAHNLVAGQMLLTLHDTEGSAGRRSYLNARDTVERLVAFGAVPVVNENDTVATSEIRYGDNDRLAARVATMAGADMLVLLSDIDGLYTAPPADDPDAKFVPFVPTITSEIEAMAGSAGSELSRGGMVTKIEAGKIATRAGCAMVIASGKHDHPLARLRQGAAATLFEATSGASARKAWIAGQLETCGTIRVDAGAAQALLRGKSLLAAGITGIVGAFDRGDPVDIAGPDGALGRGLAGYDSGDAGRIIGLSTQAIADVLGHGGRPTVIHADDMMLVASSPVGQPTG